MTTSPPDRPESPASDPAALDPADLGRAQSTPAGRRRACPRCGSRNIARIQYGLPAWSDELGAKLASGQIRLGGCVVFPRQPALACNRCGCEFERDGTIIEPGG